MIGVLARSSGVPLLVCHKPQEADSSPNAQIDLFDRSPRRSQHSLLTSLWSEAIVILRSVYDVTKCSQ